MSGISGLSSVSSASSGSGSGSSQKTQGNDDLGKDSFLKLLIAQLRNQDPMKPMDDSQFIAQMAQFNVLEQMQQMNASFQSLMNFEQLALGSNLIGKTVEATDPTTRTAFEGVVAQVNVVAGVPKLTIGNRTVDLKDVTSVS